MYLLKAAARTPGRKVLTCAPGVCEAIAGASEQAPPRQPWEPSLAMLMGVDVVTDPEMKPGRFELTHHDACEVDLEAKTVRHGRCSRTAEGVLAPAN
jgi:hypothetical protein